ncbi:MAG TPA: hypothetical protein DDW66_08815, partial [Porphyromonadaceae bacterium]|nr:hypothetical protein [Porphyromonadaceae bacterium]
MILCGKCKYIHTADFIGTKIRIYFLSTGFVEKKLVIWSFKPKTYDTFRTAPYPPLQSVARYAFSDGAPGGGSLDGCDAGAGAGDAQK